MSKTNTSNIFPSRPAQKVKGFFASLFAGKNKKSTTDTSDMEKFTFEDPNPPPGYAPKMLTTTPNLPPATSYSFMATGSLLTMTSECNTIMPFTTPPSIRSFIPSFDARELENVTPKELKRNPTTPVWWQATEALPKPNPTPKPMRPESFTTMSSKSTSSSSTSCATATISRASSRYYFQPPRPFNEVTPPRVGQVHFGKTHVSYSTTPAEMATMLVVNPPGTELPTRFRSRIARPNFSKISELEYQHMVTTNGPHTELPVRMGARARRPIPILVGEHGGRDLIPEPVVIEDFYLEDPDIGRPPLRLPGAQPVLGFDTTRRSSLASSLSSAYDSEGEVEEKEVFPENFDDEVGTNLFYIPPPRDLTRAAVTGLRTLVLPSQLANRSHPSAKGGLRRLSLAAKATVPLSGADAETVSPKGSWLSKFVRSNKFLTKVVSF